MDTAMEMLVYFLHDFGREIMFGGEKVAQNMFALCAYNEWQFIFMDALHNRVVRFFIWSYNKSWSKLS